MYLRKIHATENDTNNTTYSVSVQNVENSRQHELPYPILGKTYFVKVQNVEGEY
jgi:hypothetical protein